jgi:hypothetical protein
MRLPVSTPRRDKALQAGVLRSVIAGAVLPQAPDDPAPGTPEDTDGVLMGVAARAGACVDVGGPGIVVATGIGEHPDRIAQPVVTGPTEARVLALAGRPPPVPGHRRRRARPWSGSAPGSRPSRRAERPRSRRSWGRGTASGTTNHRCGGAGLMPALCTGKRRWRSPDGRRHPGG